MARKQSRIPFNAILQQGLASFRRAAAKGLLVAEIQTERANTDTWSRRFDFESEGNPLVGLNTEYQYIWVHVFHRARFKKQHRWALELNGDLRHPLRQPLAGAQVKRHAFPPPAISVTAAAKPVVASAAPAAKTEKKSISSNWFIGIAAVLLLWIGYAAPSDFLAHFTVFLLSCVVGYYLVWNVTHALHTPLMSVTNAISGIIVLGALLQISSDSLLVQVLAFVAVMIASINIVGGFTVTQRMLKMFTKGGE